MANILIVIHLMVVAALVVVVLLQRSEGGALGIGGGGGFMTGRGAGNALTRATGILAAIFFATSLALTLMANANRSQKSIFEGQQQRPGQAAHAAPGTAPAGGAGDLLQQLQRLDQRSAPPAAGGAAAPTPPAGGTAPSAPAPGSAPTPPAGGQ